MVVALAFHVFLTGLAGAVLTFISVPFLAGFTWGFEMGLILLPRQIEFYRDVFLHEQASFLVSAYMLFFFGVAGASARQWFVVARENIRPSARQILVPTLLFASAGFLFLYLTVKIGYVLFFANDYRVFRAIEEHMPIFALWSVMVVAVSVPVHRLASRLALPASR